MVTNERAELWKKRLADQQVSGLTVRGWCQQQAIASKQFYYWKKRLADTKNERSVSEPVFVDVSALGKEDTVGHSPGEPIHIFYHDVMIDIPEQFNHNTLLGLMKVLQKL